MTTVWLCIGVGVLAFLFGVAGLYLGKLLPETHSVDRSRDMIGAIVGLVSLLLALVLGTLIGSAYSFYATQKSELETLAAREIQLDLALSEFGPETKQARTRMKQALEGVRDMVWGDGAAKIAPELSAGLGRIRGRQRPVHGARAQPPLHWRVPPAVRRIRPNAGVDRQIALTPLPAALLRRLDCAPRCAIVGA
jgi:hypothetical protein